MPLNDQAPCTVCIPTYRQAEYLRVAIESVAAQTAPVRLIVSDDASPDHTAEVIAELQRSYRFRAMRHPANLGISANLQWLLRAAETPLIVRLDSDDLLHPRYVEQLSALIERYPEAGYAHCAIQEIDDRGHKLQVRQLGRLQPYQDAVTGLRRSVYGYQVAANVLMLRREALASVDFGAGSAAVNFVEDYDLSIALADAGWGNVYSPEVLASYRAWAAASRPAVGRKLQEVKGITHIFTVSLPRAFARHGWSLRPLKRRRFALALANAELLDRATFALGERAVFTQALMELSPTPLIRLALGAHPASRMVRKGVQLSHGVRQAMKRWIKRRLLRR